MLTGNIRHRALQTNPPGLVLVLQVEEILMVHNALTGRPTEQPSARWRDAQVEDLNTLGTIGSTLMDERGWETEGLSSNDLMKLLRGERDGS